MRNIGRFQKFRAGLKVFVPRLLSSLSRFDDGFFSMEGVEALINIACEKRNKDVVLAHNGVAVLTSILDNEEVDLDTKEAAAAALGCLSDFHEHGQEAVGTPETIKAVLKNMEGTVDLPALTAALADVCGNVALLPENCLTIVEKGGVRLLVGCAMSTAPVVRETAVRALGIVLKTLKAAGTEQDPDAGKDIFGVPTPQWRGFTSVYGSPDEATAKFQEMLGVALEEYHQCDGVALLNKCVELEEKMHPEKAENGFFQAAFVQSVVSKKPVSNAHKLAMDLIREFPLCNVCR
jgi:hypothetical protein